MGEDFKLADGGGMLGIILSLLPEEGPENDSLMSK